MPNFEDDSGNCHAPDPNGVACYKSRIGCPIHPRQKRKRHECSELSALRFNNDRLRAENERLRAEMQSAKADAWDEGYQDHQEMIVGIALKISNPYR
jgi:hypothetical protein